MVERHVPLFFIVDGAAQKHRFLCDYCAYPVRFLTRSFPLNTFPASLSPKIHWTTDRGEPTPADFGDSEEEWLTLSEKAAWVDFSHMGCIALSGPERVTFLGGLVTNQVRHVTKTRSIYSAMLTPQGRFLWDFTIVEGQEHLLLITEPDRVPERIQQLSFYILRAKVQPTDECAALGVLGVAGPLADQAIQQLFPPLEPTRMVPGATFAPEENVYLWRDPRHPGFGWRLLLPTAHLAAMRARLSALLKPAGFTAWEAYRIRLALPRAGNELISQETLPLEAGLLELNGVDFGKGCYIGQETTARTHHRGTLKKRLFQVTFPVGESLLPRTQVLLPDGKEVGVITSSAPQIGHGLAILRLAEVACNEPLRAGGVTVVAHKPTWAQWG